jgi:ribosome-associated protein
LTSHQLALACSSAAQEKKAQDIVIMDLQGITLIADYFVICTGANPIQIKAICDNINDKLKKQGVSPLRIEGFNDARWILMDYGTVIVHIFMEEERDYYNLEKLWGDAKIVSLEEQK